MLYFNIFPDILITFDLKSKMADTKWQTFLISYIIFVFFCVIMIDT